MRTSYVALAACVAAVTAAPATATIIMVDSSAIQGDNVLFSNGVQTGSLVTGKTQSGTVVNFTGTTAGGGNILRGNGGQARIEGALDTSTNNPNDTLNLTSLSFSLANSNTFNDLEFNLFGGSATSVAFTLIDNEGASFLFNGSLGNGENKFGFQGIDGQSIASITMTFNGAGIQDTRQIRLDEVIGSPSAIPEPATWAMMISGFGLVGATLRRRRQTVVTA